MDGHLLFKSICTLAWSLTPVFMNRRELHSWKEAFFPPLLLLPAPTTSPKLFQMNEGASGTKSA